MSSSLSEKSGLARMKKSALLAAAAALVIVAALIVCGCGDSPGTLVGKWSDADGTWQWEFTADGKVTSDMYVGALDYTAEDGTINVTNDGFPVNTFYYVLDGGDLVLSNPEAGDSLTLQRVE